MTDDDVTLGELSRNMAEFKRDVAGRFNTLDQTIRNSSFVSRDRYEPEQKNQDARLNRIEDNLKWLARTVVGAVLVVVIEGLLLVLIARGGS